MRTMYTSLVSLAILLPAWSASAHHSAATFYDLSASITIKGTVSEFRFINPHVRVLVKVVDQNGDTQEWLAEGANAGVLRRLGWTGNELKPGDPVTITGAPGRDGSRRVEWRVITRADGRELGGGNGLPKERDDVLQRLEQQRRQQLSGSKQ
jgi:Family of unknown function (DUF6152)